MDGQENVSWETLYAFVDDPLELIRNVDESRATANKSLGNYQIKDFFRLLNHMVEFLRPSCKFVPAYSQSYANVINKQINNDVSVEVPDEMISFMIFAMNPGTAGGSTVASRPRTVKPRLFGETQKIGDITINQYVQFFDIFVDFFFFAKDDESRLDLVEWFDEKVTTVFRPLLKVFGVERFQFEEHGEDIEVRSLHPQLFIPRSRYFVRIEKIYWDEEPIIRGFLAKMGAKNI